MFGRASARIALCLWMGRQADGSEAPCYDVNEVNRNMTADEQDCYKNVLWAMSTGCKQNPEWYAAEGLTDCPNGTILDFQCALWQMRGKRHPGKAHNCSRPCSSVLCNTAVATPVDDRDAATSPDQGASLPTWVLGALAVAAVCIIAAVAACLLCGKAEKKPKKGKGNKTRAVNKKTPATEENEEETAALTSHSQLQVAATTPAVLVQQHTNVAAFPAYGGLHGNGSFVAQAVTQAMPVGAVAQQITAQPYPVTAYAGLPTTSEQVVTHSYPVAFTGVPNTMTSMGAVIAPTSVTPVPAISTPVAYYQHQLQQ